MCLYFVYVLCMCVWGGILFVYYINQNLIFSSPEQIIKAQKKKSMRTTFCLEMEFNKLIFILGDGSCVELHNHQRTHYIIKHMHMHTHPHINIHIRITRHKYASMYMHLYKVHTRTNRIFLTQTLENMLKETNTHTHAHIHMQTYTVHLFTLTYWRSC